MTLCFCLRQDDRCGGGVCGDRPRERHGAPSMTPQPRAARTHASSARLQYPMRVHSGTSTWHVRWHVRFVQSPRSHLRPTAQCHNKITMKACYRRCRCASWRTRSSTGGAPRWRASTAKSGAPPRSPPVSRHSTARCAVEKTSTRRQVLLVHRCRGALLPRLEPWLLSEAQGGGGAPRTHASAAVHCGAVQCSFWSAACTFKAL